MNQSLIKKIFLIFVAVILAAVAAFLVIKIREKKVASQQSTSMNQTSQPVVSEQPVGNAQIENKQQAEPTASDATQENTEILGTIVQVDIVDDNSGELLLAVDADIVDQSKINDQASDETGDSELPMVSKRFTVLVQKNTPITGGTLNDLSEENDVQITSLENIYTTDKLTATNIEEL